MDNAIIVQEIIHTMARKKGKGWMMAMKLDLENAYDRLEWNFIRYTLKLLRIPNNLISLIMSCISSSAISILFNRGASEAFHPSRGICKEIPYHLTSLSFVWRYWGLSLKINAKRSFGIPSNLPKVSRPFHTYFSQMT